MHRQSDSLDHVDLVVDLLHAPSHVPLMNLVVARSLELVDSQVSKVRQMCAAQTGESLERVVCFDLCRTAHVTSLVVLSHLHMHRLQRDSPILHKHQSI